MSNVAIGIDLGTTYTVAAVYKDGQVEIIPNKEGGRLTPSVVFYDPKNPSDVSVGEIAKHCQVNRPRNYMFDMKRIIGRDYYDAYVQNFIMMEKQKAFSLQLVRASNNVPCIKLETSDPFVKTVTPEEVSSEILRYIKDSAKAYLGFDVTEAVISVPAYFGYAQKAATKRAAEKVGFRVIKLITEPVAAAIHYTFGKEKNNANLLMFDLGGGTLDVSVIKYTKDNFEVKAIEGDMFLGGRDFDDVIFDILKSEIEERFDDSLLNPNTKKGARFLDRLRKHATNYKHILSSKEQYCMLITCDNDDEYDITITRNLFEILSKPLFERIINKVKQCLSAAKVNESDIDKVVLVGGSTRIPKLRELLSEMFNGIELSTDINPDEAVALGAAIHAALLKGNIAALEQYELREVAPLSLGVLAKYDLMIIFIKKGARLPVHIEQIMETSENDQKSVVFNIYEGERKNCRYNKKLGQFLIYNLPQGRAGNVAFKVKFTLDEDGILSVGAVEKKTSTANKLQIKIKNLTLCDSTMFVSLEHEKMLREDDDMYDEFYRYRLIADTYCNSIIYDVDAPQLRSKKHAILKEVENFYQIINKLDFMKIIVLKSEFEIFKLKIGALINNYNKIIQQKKNSL